MSELKEYLENILDIDEIEKALECAKIDESFESEKNRLYAKTLKRQLEEARKEIEERQETEDSLTNEINFISDLIENIALSLEVNKKTKNDTKCVQQIIKLIKNFEEQLKEKGDDML